MARALDDFGDGLGVDADDTPYPETATPMRRLVGMLDELLRVEEDTVVTGSVRAGAMVAAGSLLHVTGVFRGPLHLAEGAMLRVAGEYGGDRFGDAGLVLVSGQCALSAATCAGVAVEAGTVLVDQHGSTWGMDENGHPFLMSPSGGLQPVTERVPVMLWSDVRQRFLPV